MQDPQGNHLARVVFPEKVDRFEVTVDLVADMVTINPFDFFLEPEAETYPFSYDPVLDQELAPFRKTETPGPLLAALLAAIPREALRTVDKLVELNTLIQHKVAYIVRMEPGVFTPEETLARGDRIVPRLGVAAGAGVAASGHGGALRLRLPDPTRARREAAGRARRARPPISPICTPGRRSICPARAGSGWMRPPACSAARAIFRSPPAPIRSRPRRSPGWWRRPR